ncbi:HlyD family secretion protein [Photobacterium damselae]|uniref:HlyD family secretion protein n=1 Tax=Photobacterium damselae TaxID=38293 RepID=UPI003D7C8C16
MSNKNLYIISKCVTNLLVIIILLIITLVIISNINAPFTSDATVKRNIFYIKPQVNGEISNIDISNGKLVNPGDLLFTISNNDYNFDLQNANADLVSAEQNVENLNIQLKKDYISLSIKDLESKLKRKDFNRYKNLFDLNQVSQQSYDNYHTNKLISTYDIKLAQNQIKQTENSLNKNSSSGIGILLKANVEIKKAKLNMDRTVVRSPIAGFITNLQLTNGEYVKAGDKVVAISGTKEWINANFNEKGLPIFIHNPNVLISFDALPGRLFKGKVKSIDYAIQDSDDEAGSLIKVEESKRWIRDTQSIPVRIVVKGIPNYLVSGSKATVMIKPDNYFWSMYTELTMKFVSYFKYVY